MTSEGPGRPYSPRDEDALRQEHETAHVENATIDVSEATIIQSPQARMQAKYLAYALCVLFVFTIAIGAANLLFTSSQVHSVRNNSQALAAQQVALRKANIALGRANASS